MFLILLMFPMFILGCEEPSPTELEIPQYYYPYDVIRTMDNNYLAVGGHYYYGQYKGFILKFDDDGNMLWSKDYEGAGALNKIKHLRDGRFIAVGSGMGEFAGVPNVWGMYAALLDESGNKIWEGLYFIANNTSHGAGDVEETDNGNFLIVGGFGSSDFFGIFRWSDAVIWKIDSNGNEITRKRFRDYDGFYSIIKSSDGNFIITGSATLKVDSDLNIIWQNDTVRGHVIKRLGTGEYVIADRKVPSDPNEPYKVVVSKIDEKGNLLSSFEYQCDRGFVNGIVSAEVDSGNIVLSYGCTEDQMNYQIFAMKIDENGNVIWKKMLREQQGSLNTLIKTADENYIFILDDFYAVKIDKNGNVIWEKELIP